MKRCILTVVFALMLLTAAQAVTMPAGLTMTELKWVATPVPQYRAITYRLYCTIKNTSKATTYDNVRVESCLLDKVKGKSRAIVNMMENFAPGDFWRFKCAEVTIDAKENFNARYSGRIDKVLAY